MARKSKKWSQRAELKLRLPEVLRDSLEYSAKERGDSMNSEIVKRLNSTFQYKQDDRTAKIVARALLTYLPSRLIALPVLAVAELRQHRTRQAERVLRLGIALNEDHYVCARLDGGPSHPTRLTRLFRQFMRDHKLPPIRFHDLRHSHATHMLAAGIHPKIAQERLGHSSIAVTMDTYSHAMPNMQQDAVAKLDAALRLAMNKRDTNRR